MKKLKKKSKGSTSGGGSQKSPQAYIKSGMAKKLPIYRCAVTADWKETGKGHVYIARQHASQNITIGFFLLDFYCLGLKDTFYKFNMPLHEFEKLYNSNPYPLTQISGNTAFNMIYEAIDFATEAGISPHKDFAITKHMIADEDDIEYEDIPVGKDGVHCLFLMPDENRNKEITSMRKNLGEGNFMVIDGITGDYDGDDEEDLLSRSIEEVLNDNDTKILQAYMSTPQINTTIEEEVNVEHTIITGEPITNLYPTHPQYTELHQLTLNGEASVAQKKT